ncbi:hypothetical protein Pmani_038366, partial [Petrolisthes manimaculis]
IHGHTTPLLLMRVPQEGGVPAQQPTGSPGAARPRPENGSGATLRDRFRDRPHRYPGKECRRSEHRGRGVGGWLLPQRVPSSRRQCFHISPESPGSVTQWKSRGPSTTLSSSTTTKWQLDKFDEEDDDWAFVAMVLDRLLLWIFGLTAVLGTIVILCESPFLYDSTEPIDMELSQVAKQQLEVLDF